MIYHDNTDEPWRGIDAHSLNGLEYDVRKTTKNLREYLDEFDSIVVTGMSGVVVGVPVSMRLRKPLVILRKPNDNSHHGRDKFINRAKLGDQSLFLDDFVSSAKTRSHVVKKVEAEGGQVVAQYTYRDHEYRSLA